MPGGVVTPGKDKERGFLFLLSNERALEKQRPLGH